MSFDYPITCPIIDKQIGLSKDSFRALAQNLLEEACPLMSFDSRHDVSRRWAEEMYEACEEYFETVRSTNQDMRKAAEKRIESLEDEVEDLKCNIIDLEDEVEDLKRHINNLEDEIAELKYQIKGLED